MTNKSQQISYLRIANTAVAWFFIIKAPINFASLWLLADGLSFLEILFYAGSLTPETDAMLRAVADLMWTALLIFGGVMYQARHQESVEGLTVDNLN